MGNFIVLSGTPAVGTRHLYNAATQLHHLPLERVILATSREPRLGEKDGRDFHFQSAQELYEKAGVSLRYLCFQVDKDNYALDLNEVKGIAGIEGKTGLLEINPAVFPRVRRRLESDGVKLTTVFVSPVTRNEIELMLKEGGIDGVSENIKSLTIRKLMMRASREMMPHGEIAEKDIREIVSQAQGAFDCLMPAADYQWVLPNHNGDGDPNWGWEIKDPVFGDPARTLASFVAIAQGLPPIYAESWKGLFPKGTLALGVPVLEPHK
jgi:guanylate kinase